MIGPQANIYFLQNTLLFCNGAEPCWPKQQMQVSEKNPENTPKHRKEHRKDEPNPIQNSNHNPCANQTDRTPISRTILLVLEDDPPRPLVHSYPSLRTILPDVKHDPPRPRKRSPPSRTYPTPLLQLASMVLTLPSS